MDTVDKSFPLQFFALRYSATRLLASSMNSSMSWFDVPNSRNRIPSGTPDLAQVEFDFNPFKGKRAGGKAFCTKVLRKVMQGQQLFLHITLTGINDLLGFTVGESLI